jgi:hypothetical protein
MRAAAASIAVLAVMTLGCANARPREQQIAGSSCENAVFVISLVNEVALPSGGSKLMPVTTWEQEEEKWVQKHYPGSKIVDRVNKLGICPGRLAERVQILTPDGIKLFVYFEPVYQRAE